jgi:quercetin dioxygenase-like cupin family protein
VTIRDDMNPEDAKVQRGSDYIQEAFTWGELRWQISGSMGNSNDLTVGWCLLEKGASNGRHSHPNCSEVLIVMEGKIEHSWSDRAVLMSEGDMISIPRGVVHHAKNLGESSARLLVCFSSAERLSVSENED